MGIKFENGGILTTVQDGGRFGYEQYGMTPSGPMDMRSMNIANLLVGNDRGEGCLEMTLMGPTIRFTDAAVIAVTGADMQPRLNGAPLNMYAAVAVNSGDRLEFGLVREGCRTYLAVAGGMKIPELMGSKSTLLSGEFGGYSGRKLRNGDEIFLNQRITALPGMATRQTGGDSFSSAEHVLRVILGPQEDRFTKKGMETFLNEAYRVGQDFDRRGYRLEGPVIEHRTDGNIISDGLVTGSIQVPTAGEPIIMLAEHQTVGGYTKIATVITVDLPIIGQCKSGDVLRFKAVSVEKAQDLYAAYHQEMNILQQRMALAVPAICQFKLTIGKDIYHVQVEEMEG